TRSRCEDQQRKADKEQHKRITPAHVSLTGRAIRIVSISSDNPASASTANDLPLDRGNDRLKRREIHPERRRDGLTPGRSLAIRRNRLGLVLDPVTRRAGHLGRSNGGGRYIVRRRRRPHGRGDGTSRRLRFGRPRRWTVRV